MHNIILIGMRGSGKSTIAKKLSKKLNKPYIEIDTRIAQNAGTSIPEIVQKYGWEYFRDIETQTTQQVCQENNSIISTGGGVVIRPENITALKASGKIFYLRAPIRILLRRIGHDVTRPALTTQQTLKDEMEEILKQRKHLYEGCADSIIDIDKKSKTQIIEEIIQHL